MKLSVTLKLTNALMLLFPLVLLTGCVKQQKPQVEYRTIKQPRINLPSELTSQIKPPEIPERMTFGESVSLNAELIDLLARCNIDRAGIRKIELTDPRNSGAFFYPQ